MVEAALITPLVMLMLFGIIEFGLLFRDELSASRATRESARTVAAAPRDADYDDAAIAAVDESLGALSPGDGDEVVLFKAAVDEGTGRPLDHPIDDPDPISTCETSCLRWEYQDDAWQPDLSKPGWPANPSDPGTGEQQNACAGEQDYFGVYVSINHAFLTPLIGDLFGGDFDVSDMTIMRLEPFAGTDTIPCAPVAP